MKIFSDSASLEELTEVASLGVVDGVTTNPSLIAKEGADIHTRILQICEIIDGPVSAEVVATAWEEMVEEGRELAGIHENVVVKVPIGADGLRAVKKLRGEDINTNVTLIFNPAQAVLAAKAGASYISPFVGRLDDITIPGMEMVRDIVRISKTTIFRPRCWWRASAARFISSRRPRWARTWRRFRPRSSRSSSSIR